MAVWCIAQVAILQQQLLAAAASAAAPVTSVPHVPGLLSIHTPTTAKKLQAAAGAAKGQLASHPLSAFKADSTPGATPSGPSPTGSPMRRYTDDTLAHTDTSVTPGLSRPASLCFEEGGE